MAEGNGNGGTATADKLSDNESAVLSHINTQPAARTVAELQNSYTLNAEREGLPAVGKQGIESAVKSLAKKKLVKKVGQSPDGDDAYAPLNEKGKVRTGE